MLEKKSGWDIKDYNDAKAHAEELTEDRGELYIAVDRGSHVSPRYDVIRAPAIGDEVSYAFNGDYYPCGEITKISPTMKKITTSTGDTFYRRRESGSWLKNKTWSLVNGHISRMNPHF